MATNEKGKILNISSLENPLIKKTRSLLKKKFREIHNNFIAEGNFFLNEAINSKWKICYALCNVAEQGSFKNNNNLTPIWPSLST